MRALIISNNIVLPSSSARRRGAAAADSRFMGSFGKFSRTKISLRPSRTWLTYPSVLFCDNLSDDWYAPWSAPIVRVLPVAQEDRNHVATSPDDLIRSDEKEKCTLCVLIFSNNIIFFYFHFSFMAVRRTVRAYDFTLPCSGLIIARRIGALKHYRCCDVYVRTPYQKSNDVWKTSGFELKATVSVIHVIYGGWIMLPVRTKQLTRHVWLSYDFNKMFLVYIIIFPQ